MKYFTAEDMKDPESLKKAFRRRCLELHPDKGGDADAFKEMQEEFKQVVNSIGHSAGSIFEDDGIDWDAVNSAMNRWAKNRESFYASMMADIMAYYRGQE